MTDKPLDPIMDVLDSIRGRRGLSIGAWSRVSGVSRQRIYRALNSQISPSLETVRMLARSLDIDLELAHMKPRPLKAGDEDAY